MAKLCRNSGTSPVTWNSGTATSALGWTVGASPRSVSSCSIIAVWQT